MMCDKSMLESIRLVGEEECAVLYHSPLPQQAAYMSADNIPKEWAEEDRAEWLLNTEWMY